MSQRVLVVLAVMAIACVARAQFGIEMETKCAVGYVRSDNEISQLYVRDVAKKLSQSVHWTVDDTDTQSNTATFDRLKACHPAAKVGAKSGAGIVEFKTSIIPTPADDSATEVVTAPVDITENNIKAVAKDLKDALAEMERARAEVPVTDVFKIWQQRAASSASTKPADVCIKFANTPLWSLDGDTLKKGDTGGTWVIACPKTGPLTDAQKDLQVTLNIKYEMGCDKYNDGDAYSKMLMKGIHDMYTGAMESKMGKAAAAASAIKTGAEEKFKCSFAWWWWHWSHEQTVHSDKNRMPYFKMDIDEQVACELPAILATGKDLKAICESSGQSASNRGCFAWTGPGDATGGCATFALVEERLAQSDCAKVAMDESKAASCWAHLNKPYIKKTYSADAHNLAWTAPIQAPATPVPTGTTDVVSLLDAAHCPAACTGLKCTTTAGFWIKADATKRNTCMDALAKKTYRCVDEAIHCNPPSGGGSTFVELAGRRIPGSLKIFENALQPKDF